MNHRAKFICLSDKSEFEFECHFLPRIGEVISHNGKTYAVVGVAHNAAKPSSGLHQLYTAVAVREMETGEVPRFATDIYFSA